MRQQVFCLLTLFWLSVYCHANDIVLYTPKYNETASLQQALATAFTSFDTINDLSEVKPTDLVVGTGSQFLSTPPQRPEVKRLSVLHYNLGVAPAKGQYFRYFHAPPQLVLDRLGKYFPGKKIAFLFKDEHDPFHQLVQSGRYEHIELVGFPASGDVFTSLRKLRQAHQFDLFLMTNDTRIFRHDVLRYLLEELYRNQIPVIGMSQQLINAGATIVFTPKIDTFMDQTLDIAHAIVDNKSIPQSTYASDVEVLTNALLMQRYGLSLSHLGVETSAF